MRYFIITLSNGYCGCDEEYCLMFPKETTDENITAYACELLNEYVENYEYDYIIENDGTLEQLEKVAKLFVCDVICGEYIPEKDKPFTLTCSKY